MSGSEALERVQQEFSRETVWLNTASMGLPPVRTTAAVREALDDWEAGRADAVAYDEPLGRARRTYAALVGVDPGLVAVGSQASVMVGVVASSLVTGDEVLTAQGDFTSVTFPFHARAAAGHGVVVREVPLERLADEVRPATSWVAVSTVQSADGRVADVEALADACRAHGARLLLDTTQAVGWLPVDASGADVTVCGGYKWLMAPRGTAFMTVARDLVEGLVPTGAGWYAGDRPWESIYGAPLRLAADARRFDVSPAWHAWVGAAPSLDLLAEVGREALHAHATRLAARFCEGTGLPYQGSAVVSCRLDDAGAEAMRVARVVGATRAGRLRLSFHVSTTTDDVEEAVRVLCGRVSL